MKTFKNKNYKKRDYECTNIIMCTAEKAPNENWVETKEETSELNPLWREGNVDYYGYL